MTSNELEIFKQSILDDVRVMMQTTGQVTQYIGARYVPLFADPLEWSNTKEYEPLTIVINQGNSYTSRQFVPRGIDISNTEFWANTGNYNAQIEQYRQEVAAFDGRIAENKQAIAENKQAIVAETNRAKEAVHNLANGKYTGTIVAFGDSITRGYGTTDLHSWAWYVANFFGANLKNYAIDGASFSVSIANQVDTAASDNSYIHSDVKIVLIGGGINDHEYNYTQIFAGVKKTIDKVKAEFPNAKIYIVPCLSAARFMNQIDQGDKKLIHIPAINSVLTACLDIVDNGIAVMESAPLLLKGTNRYAADNVHPNNGGSKIIGASVYSWINGGNGYNGIIQDQIKFNEDINVISSVVISNGYSFYADLHFRTTTTIPANTPITPENTWLGFSFGTVSVFPSMTELGTGPMFFVTNMKLSSREQLEANKEFYITINGVVGA